MDATPHPATPHPAATDPSTPAPPVPATSSQPAPLCPRGQHSPRAAHGRCGQRRRRRRRLGRRHRRLAATLSPRGWTPHCGHRQTPSGTAVRHRRLPATVVFFSPPSSSRHRRLPATVVFPPPSSSCHRRLLATVV